MGAGAETEDSSDGTHHSRVLCSVVSDHCAAVIHGGCPLPCSELTEQYVVTRSLLSMLILLASAL